MTDSTLATVCSPAVAREPLQRSERILMGTVDLPPAVRMALNLTTVLARTHGIVADLHGFLLHGEALISVCAGLVVRASTHRYQWVVPGSAYRRGRPLWTYASRPARAAARLAIEYEQLRTQSVTATVLRARC